VAAAATASARLPRAALRTAADGDTEEEDGEADEQEDEDEGEEGGVAPFRQPRTASPALRSSNRHISATSSLAASPVRTQRSLQQQQPPQQQQSQTHLQPTPPATANLEHKSQERAQQHLQQQQEEGAEESDEDPVEEEDDDDAAARRAVARMAASPLASSAAAQFSRPGASFRAQGLRPSAPAVANATPDKSARPLSAALRPAAQGGSSGGSGGSNTLYSAGTSMMGGGSGVGAGGRPKTSVGSGRSRFAAGRFNDSFEDDLDDDEEEVRGTGQPQLGAEENEETEEPMHQRSVTPPPPQPAQFGGQNDARAGVGSGGGSRTLNPRRAAGVNLSSVQGSLGSGFVSPSRPPVESAHLGRGGDSDAEVSDVSSVINLNEGVATRAHAVAAAEAAERPHTPPAASPSLAPALGSATIGSAVVQGRGRPRGQPSKLSGGGSNPSPPPRFGGDHGDSLSSLLGGGMRRPGGGRGLSSGPGSFRSKLPVAAVLDSDDDDDIDMY
jgi:chemotaxis protein histidine kinase CheA